MVMCSTPSPGEEHPQGTPPCAVLLMAYGGPDTLDDVEPFVMDIRGGRKTPPELLDEIRERYAHIGGGSPLLRITTEQAEALERVLNTPDPDISPAPDAPRFQVFVGMKHWTPTIHDALADIVNGGFRHLVTLCMTPVYSSMTVAEYYEKLQRAQEKLGGDLHIYAVETWHTHPLYIEAIAEHVSAALKQFPPEVRSEVRLVFSAHSLPASVVEEEGDPYDRQLREVIHLVINRLEMGAKADPPLSERWHFCYQSAGARPVKWLGPSIDETIRGLASEGHRNLLIAPIGFLCDHVEILYDIDVECRNLADSLGVRMERIASLNTSPTFIDALASIVQQARTGKADKASKEGKEG